MMRSLYSGVAGLKTHQIKMDVIGNNIANVNTTAFKSSSITFSELMSQTTQRASGPNATTGTGGVNARQIGLGSKSGAININITGQGSTQSTGNPFDIMINGSNFFVVNNGSENFFTRDGSFYVDGGGNLAMTSTGYNVMGWSVDEATGSIKKDTVSALRIMSAANMTYPPEATSKAYMAGILDRNDTDVTSANGKAVNLNFFDNLGYSYTAKFIFKQSDDIHSYSVELDKILDSDGKELDLSKISGPVFGDGQRQNKTTSVAFDYTKYEWNAGVLRDKTTNEEVAKLSTMFDTGSLKDRNTEVQLNSGATTTTVQAQLDAIAKTYAYEGSTEDFLNLIMDTSDTVNGVSNASFLELLANSANNSTDATGPNAAFPYAAGSQAITTAQDATFAAMGRNFEGTNITFNSSTGYIERVGGSNTDFTTTLNLSGMPGGNFSNIVIDFTDVSNFDNKGTSTMSATSGDKDGLGMGRRLGDMIGVSVQNNGMIYASYDNGMTKLLGQIATAAFANASGLEKKGDNLYSATMNSGEFDGIGEDITAGGGYMSTGQLEMSNVDLSAEFTEMITTQRGFQANSRIITVSDTLLEELTNLKR